MKILLVVEKPEIREILVTHLKPRGFEFICYANPIKAMDNIEEVMPDIVMFSAEDFPRHWKPFLNLLREIRSKEDSIFILLVGPVFPFEEAAKASYLKVHGILNEDLSDQSQLKQVEGLLTRYKLLKDRRVDYRYIPGSYDELEFLFTNPKTMKLITGVITDISIGGASFIADNPRLIENMDDGSSIPHCTIRIEDRVIAVSCEVIRNRQLLSLRFRNLPEDSRSVLTVFIKKRMDRRLEKEKGSEKNTEDGLSSAQ